MNKSNGFFTDNVIKVVKQIPKGKFMTYKQIAVKAGNALAYRAVGTIMQKNKDPKIPCHRVIRSDGSVGYYNGINKNKLAKKEIVDLMEAKVELLKEEGVKIIDGKVIFKN